MHCDCDCFDCETKIRKRKFKRKFLRLIALLFALIVYVYFCAVNLIFDYAGKDFQYYVSNCSYYAIKKCLEDGVAFSDLYSIRKNEAGEILSIETDAFLINYISQKLALDCYDYLSEYTEKGVGVPLGAFSGIRLIAGYGKKINVKLTHTLSVECKILRKFTTAGINQTRQILSAVIHSDITVYSLFKSKYYDGDIEVVLCDNIIIGKVPELYLAGGVLSGFSAGS